LKESTEHSKDNTPNAPSWNNTQVIFFFVFQREDLPQKDAWGICFELTQNASKFQSNVCGRHSCTRTQNAFRIILEPSYSIFEQISRNKKGKKTKFYFDFAHIFVFQTCWSM
jgi:hypothetical protein